MKILGWLLQRIEPGFLRWEVEITTTMPPINDVFEIIAMSYLAIQTENAVKFELQSW